MFRRSAYHAAPNTGIGMTAHYTGCVLFDSSIRVDAINQWTDFPISRRLFI